MYCTILYCYDSESRPARLEGEWRLTDLQLTLHVYTAALPYILLYICVMVYIFLQWLTGLHLTLHLLISVHPKLHWLTDFYLTLHRHSNLNLTLHWITSLLFILPLLTVSDLTLTMFYCSFMCMRALTKASIHFITWLTP